jgi:threonine synthase
VFDLFPEIDHLREEVGALSVSDDEIAAVIRSGEKRDGRVWDPHTATAVHALRKIGGEHWIVVATAHPAKFGSVVEPLVGHEVELPPALRDLLQRPARFVEITPELDALTAAMG